MDIKAVSTEGIPLYTSELQYFKMPFNHDFTSMIKVIALYCNSLTLGVVFEPLVLQNEYCAGSLLLRIFQIFACYSTRD